VGIGTSLLLIAVGAILRFAVSATTSGFNIHTVGVILMIVGGVGLVISMFFWSSWGGFGGYARERRVTSDGRGGYVERERDI
jgi:membrane-bound ClpP family serine protease